MTETLRARWLILIRSGIWSVAALLLVQLLAGAWTLSLMSFFPIYLEEQLRYAPVAIAGMVAVGQASGMFAALLGGGLSDTLGSKWVLVLGLLGGVVASLIFQSGVPLMVAALWGLAGASGSLQTLGGSSYLTRMADPRRLGLLAALYALSGTLGGALGSPVAGRILDTAGYRAYGLVGLGLAALTVLLAVILLPNQQRQAHNQAAGSSRDSMWAMTKRPVMRLLMALRFLPTIYYGMSIVLIPLMINHLAGNKTTVALYSTVEPDRRLHRATADRPGRRPLRTPQADAGGLRRVDRGRPGTRRFRRSVVGRLPLRGDGSCGGVVAGGADVRPRLRWRPQRRARPRIRPAARHVEPRHDRRCAAGRRADACRGRPAFPGRRPARCRVGRYRYGVLRAPG